MSPPVVFISSTSRDLPEEREAVLSACRALGLGAVAMEDFPATGKGATAASLRQLDRASVYVGIIAHRYGYIEPGHERSVTECEYEHAKSRQLDCLCFLLDPRIDWPEERRPVEGREQLERFKERIKGERVVNWFLNPHDLRYQVYRALELWLCDQGQPPSGPRILPTLLGNFFVGRDGDLKALEEHHARGAAISIIQGLGGMGKTTLAQRLAERLAIGYPDGHLYLELKGASDRRMTIREAQGAIIRSFRGPEHGVATDDGDLTREYRQTLAGKKVLLFLDDAASAEQIRPLLPPAGTTAAVLVTSRQMIVLPGARTHSLETLPLDEAALLLRAIAPRLSEVEAQAVATACGCLPLALCLAGTTLQQRCDYSSDYYLRRLREKGRLRELDGVTAAIRVSEELLPDDVRRSWHQLAVFAGGFEKSWAMAVWKVDEFDADDCLGALLKQSLLDWDEHRHWYRFHDLVREYASSSVEEQSRQRHRDLFLAEMTAANTRFRQGGPGVREGLQRFERVWGEAREAFRHARSLQSNTEARRFCSLLPVVAGDLLELRQLPQERIEWVTVAGGAALQLHDQQREGDALDKLGLAWRDLGNLGEAETCHHRHLEIAQQRNDLAGQCQAQGRLSIVFRRQGRLNESLVHAAQQLELARTLGDRYQEGAAQSNMGNTYAELANALGFHHTFAQQTRQQGITCLQEHLAISREIGNRVGEGHALGNLGLVYSEMLQPEQAVELYKQAIDIQSELGNCRDEAVTSWNLGMALVRLQRFAEAISHLEVAVAFEQAIGHPEAAGHADYVESVRHHLANNG